MGDELGRCYDCGEWDYGGEYEENGGKVHLCNFCCKVRTIDNEKYKAVLEPYLEKIRELQADIRDNYILKNKVIIERNIQWALFEYKCWKHGSWQEEMPLYHGDSHCKECEKEVEDYNNRPDRPGPPAFNHRISGKVISRLEPRKKHITAQDIIKDAIEHPNKIW